MVIGTARPDPTKAEVAPERLDHDGRRAGRDAANEARRRYPGPAGVVLAREIDAYVEFGFRFGRDSPMVLLIAELTQDR